MIWEEKRNITEDLEQLNHMIEMLPSGLAILKGGRGCRMEIMNTAFLQSVGYSKEDILAENKDMYQFCYREDRDMLEQMLEEARGKKKIVEGELRFCDKEGKMHWLMLSIRLYGYRDAIPYYIAASWDVDERKRMEDEILLQTERYKMIEELAKEQPIDYDVERNSLRISEATRKCYHLPAGELLKEELERVIHAEDKERYHTVLKNMLEKETEGKFEYRTLVEEEDGTVHYVWHRAYYKSIAGNSGKVMRIIGRIKSIDKEKRMQNQLMEKARKDAMTGLLNKQALREEIEEFFAEEPAGTHAFMVIDIDNFKKINDTFGHIFGDNIIKEVANKIMNKFRGMDIIGRVGGDEFVVCMKYTTLEHAKEKAQSLCDSVKKKYYGEYAQRSITCSVGISIYGKDGADYESLFRRADLAMYRAKISGKNGYQLADDDMDIEARLPQNREKRDDDYQIVSKQDKEFITFAFELLSQAKDMDGSINMLLEKIGKRYRLSKVAIYERKKSKSLPVLTNCWVNNARYLKLDLSEQRLKLWEKHRREGRMIISDCSDENIPKEDKLMFNELGVKSYAEYSYGEKGNPRGYITFCDCEKSREWTEFEQRTFSEIVRMLSVFVMLRTQREEDKHEIQSLQDLDPLTGLYNLNTFKRKAEKILRTADEDEQFAFICVDINGFSYVNEQFGYSEGDQLLERTADFIENIPQVLLACRRYADLFLMMTKVSSKNQCVEDLVVYNRKLRQMIQENYSSGNLYESIGVCFWNQGNYDVEELIENANLARKVAKKDKEFWLNVYSEQMKEERNRERIIAASFYPALNNDEFEIYLQPKFLLDERKIYGAEALARWRRLDGRYHNPDDFIPVLEKLGYINELDFHIFEEAVRWLKKWNQDGKEPLVISTNFSGQHFKDLSVDFIERVCKITELYGVPNEQLEIEITESVAVQELDKLQEILEALRKKGFRIAIDDFGTGYSSLNILFDIPVDVVKIDKSFINTENFEKRKQLVMHIGEMVKLADEEIIFEGIENQEQIDFLLECGYRYGQGYIFDKPLRVLDFEQKYLYEFEENY